VTKKILLPLVLFIVLLLLHINYYADYQTTLLPGVYIQDGQSDLASLKWSVPLVYDWDADGRKDLLVGGNHVTSANGNRIDQGYVAFYKNIGPDAGPEFNGFTPVQFCSRECSNINATAFG